MDSEDGGRNRRNTSQNSSGSAGGSSPLSQAAAQVRLGKVMVEEGLLSREQLSSVLADCQTEPDGFVDELLRRGLVSTRNLIDLFASGKVSGDLLADTFRLPPSVLALAPAGTARRLEVVPLAIVRDMLVVAAAEPLERDARDELESAAGLPVTFVVCSPDDVRAALDRCYPPAETPGGGNGRGLQGATRLRNAARVIQEVDSLPALPETVERLQELSQDPSATVTDVANTLILDPPMAAKIMSIANSAAYGFPHQIRDIKLAISLMGLREVYSVALSVAVVNFVKNMRNVDYRRFWLDSVCCAAATRFVQRTAGLRNLPGVFAGGLLHDIGRAVLWEVAPRYDAQFDPVLTGRALIDEEERAVGIGHAEAGYEVARRWNLPDEIGEAIRFHHTPHEACVSRETVSVVAVADRMSCARGSDYEENMVVFEGMEETLAYLRIDVELAEAMLDGFLRHRERAAGEALS